MDKVNNYLNDVYDYKEIKEEVRKDIDTIEKALFKGQENEKELDNLKYENKMLIKESIRDIKIIEKQHKVLEIMKDKWVNVVVLIHSKTVDEYNNNAHTPYNLIQEEFDLLKEMFA